MIKINIDASTHPKYKKSVGCFIIKQDETTTVETFSLDATDNHTAEFQTLLNTLEYCLEKQFQDELIFIYSDSKIVVNSFNKHYVKNAEFDIYLEKILSLSSEFSLLSIEWVPENQNKQADHHAKRALQKNLKNTN